MPQVRGRTESEKRKPVEHGRTTIARAKPNDHRRKALPVGQTSTKSRAPESSQHHKFPYTSQVTPSNIQLGSDAPRNFYRFPMKFHGVNLPYQFPSHDTMRLPPFRPYADSFVMPPSLHQGANKSYYNTHHAYSNSRYEFETRNFNHLSAHPFSLGAGTGTYGGRKKGSHPS